MERLVGEDGTDRHIKHVLLRGRPWRRLAVLLGRDPVRHEARQLRRLARCGVTAPQVEGTERRWRRGLPVELLLTTQTLAGYRSLAPGEEDDPEWAGPLGRFLRRLHDLGILHRDLHRGNLLARPTHGGQPADFALLDADRVRFRRSLTTAGRVQGLLTVLRGLRGLRADPAWSSFLEGYDALSLGLDAASLGRTAEQDLRAHLRRRSRRALRDNPEFGRVDVGGIVWQARRGYLPPSCPTEVLEDPRSRVKRGRSSSVAWLGDSAVLKAFHKTGLLGGLADFIRGSRAQRAFLRGHLLELLGIPTPRVLAFADVRRRPGRSLSYLVCERVGGALQATTFLAGGPEQEDLLSFLRQVGRLVGQLHRAGLAHRDLKGRNILHVPGGQAVVLDLDGLADRGRVVAKERRRNLARLMRSGGEVAGLGAREAFVLLRAYLKAFKGQ